MQTPEQQLGEDNMLQYQAMCLPFQVFLLLSPCPMFPSPLHLKVAALTRRLLQKKRKKKLKFSQTVIRENKLWHLKAWLLIWKRQIPGQLKEYIFF